MKKITILASILLGSCSSFEKDTIAPLVVKYEALKFSEEDTTIAQEFSDPSNFEKFKKTICATGATDPQCIPKYADTTFARLRERYYFADINKLTVHCQAHPIECRDINYLEHYFIVLHNFGVEDRKQREIASKTEEKQRRDAEMWSGLAGAFQQQEANRLRQQEINLQNQPINTYCHTSGTNTQCTSK